MKSHLRTTQILIARQVRCVFLGKMILLMLGITTVFSATGCTSFRQWKANGFKVGPNYCRPEAQTEMQWIDITEEPRLSIDAPDLSSWWQSFNDPVLNDLIDTAYQQNITLREAAARIKQAQAIRGIAVGNLAPQLQIATLNYQRVQTSQNDAVPSPVRILDDWSTGMTAAWELDFWGRFRRSVDAADAALDASVADYDDALVILLADVASTYVEIRTIQERIDLTRKNVESQQGSLKLADTRFRARQTNKLDVIQARNNVAFTESVIPLLEAQLRIANNRLCVLLGTPPRDLVAELPPGPIPTVDQNFAVGIPTDLLRRRPDIRRTERLLKVQSERIGVASADLYPRISLLGSFEWQAEELDDLFSSASLFGLVGPSVDWKVFNYGRIRNSIENERAKFEERVYQYQQQVLVAQREVEDAIVSCLKSQDQSEKIASAVNDVEEAEDIVTTLYRTGATDFNRVFLIQSTKFIQQDDLVATRANVVLGLISVYRAMGGGWEIRCSSDSNVVAIDAQDVSFEQLPANIPEEALDAQPNAEAANESDAGDANDAEAPAPETDIPNDEDSNNDSKTDIERPAAEPSVPSEAIPKPDQPELERGIKTG